MLTGIDQSKGKNIMLYQINQQPVCFNVAFAESLEFSGQSVIPVFFIELSALSKGICHGIQKRKIKASFFHELITLLIAQSEFDLVHLVFQQCFLQVLHIGVTLYGRITGNAPGFVHRV